MTYVVHMASLRQSTRKTLQEMFILALVFSNVLDDLDRHQLEPE